MSSLRFKVLTTLRASRKLNISKLDLGEEIDTSQLNKDYSKLQVKHKSHLPYEIFSDIGFKSFGSS